MSPSCKGGAGEVDRKMDLNVFTSIQAKLESTRCLMCADAPCSCNCPAGVDARSFIRKIRFDNIEGAVRSLRQSNVLAASCSYICPTGTSCTRECTAKELLRPIDISGLQRYVMNYEIKNGMVAPEVPPVNGKKVAVVGAGPAGLGCAAELRVRGHEVVVFEASNVAGGMLKQSIPSFRLPVEVVDFEVEFIEKLGVEFKFGSKIDDPKKLLKDGFDAVFLGTGLPKSKNADFMNADLPGVYQALDFLKMSKEGNMPEIGKRVLVIGGGDTALDAARVAKMAGAESFIVYRRTQSEMPAYPNEIEDAWHEGVEFYFRVLPRAVVGDEKVTGLKCVRIKWHKLMPGMPRGYDVEGTEFVTNCDTVITAIGQEPDDVFGMRASPGGMIAVEQNTFKTSVEGIYAAGDVVDGGGTAAKAVGMGKLAAMQMDVYLNSK